MFDCPVCHITHDEPAEALLGVHVACLDCYFESTVRERFAGMELPAAA